MPDPVAVEDAAGVQAAPKQPVVPKVTISARATPCPSAVNAKAVMPRAKALTICEVGFLNVVLLAIQCGVTRLVHPRMLIDAPGPGLSRRLSRERIHEQGCAESLAARQNCSEFTFD